MNPRVIIATTAVAVATFLFSLVAPPLLSLISTDTAHAQQQSGPKIDIEFDPGHTVREGEEINFTLTFSGLDGSTDLTYDVDVVTSGDSDIPLCEGTGAGTDLALGSYSGATTTATGTILATCTPRKYVLVVTLKDGSGEDLTRSASGFRVQEFREWELPGTQPTSPAGLWGESIDEVVDGKRHIYTLLHVVDNETGTVYVYRVRDQTEGHREDALTFVRTYQLSGTNAPWGIASDSTTTWVANDGTDAVTVYSKADPGERISEDEFSLSATNTAPRGIQSDFVTDDYRRVYIVDSDADKVFYYHYDKSPGSTSTGFTHVPEHDLKIKETKSPTGLFFDTFTMYVADEEDDKIYAYRDYPLGEGGFKPAPDYDINDLDRVGNEDPAGVWVDYTWVYVVDSEDKKIYAYEYPRHPYSPMIISGPPSITIPENSTTTGKIFTATDPNPRDFGHPTRSRASLRVHTVHTGHTIFDLDKTRDISTSTAEFELIFSTSSLRYYEDPNYENPKDANEDNIYELLIQGGGIAHAPHSYFPLKVEITDVKPEKPYFWEKPVTLRVADSKGRGHHINPPVEAVNPDNEDTHIYTLGGDDAASFNISASIGYIIVDTDLDYDTKDSYSVTVSIRDGEGPATSTVDDTVNVTIEVFKGPEITGPTSKDFAENDTSDVATFTATNPGSEELEWSLEGDDAGDFTIATTTSGATLRFATTPNFENAVDDDTDNTYEITVVAESGSLRGDMAVTVTVTDENDAPSFSEGSSTSRDVDEGDQADRPVGNPVTATEQDAGDTLIYSLGGTDSSSFEIDTSTGQIKTNAPLDFDGGKKTYDVTVEVRDSRDADGNSDTDTDDTIDVTINVQAVNEPPVLTGTSTINYLENGSGPVGTYTATDPEGQNIIWGLSGDDEDSFTITGGVLEFVTPPDHEDDDYYFVIVEASDNNGTSSLQVNVYIEDVNETPDVTGDTSPEFAENGSGTVTTYEDGDPEQRTITWSLAGDDAGSMDISSGGNLTFNSPPDHETKDTYNVTVQAFDGNSTGTLAVVVTVTDVNEDPEFPMATTSRSVEENAGANAPVGLPVAAEDPDEDDTLIYTLSGTDASLFSIGADGQITAKSSLDSDVRASYEVTVEVHDGKAADGTPSTDIDDTVVVTITVSDVNEPPTLTGTTTVSIAEDSGTTVATYSADDPERGTLTWDLSGDDSDDFDITGGVLTFKTMPDREAATDENTDNVYHVTVEVTDGNNTVNLNVTVTVTDVNEAPAFPLTEDGQRSVEENTSSGEPVGAPVAAEDPDEDASLTYILSGTNASSFDINASSGQILTKDALDEDTKSTYYVTVEVHDGKADDGSPSTTTDAYQDVTITVTGINEPPVVTGSTAIEYAENDTSTVETYTATDPERGQITWGLSGTDEDDFTITQSGVLEFSSDPDYEEPTDSEPNNVYNVNVLAGDGNSTSTHPVTVTVTNVNELPAFPGTGSVERSVVENTAASQPIGDPVQATDPDHGDTLTYTLSGNDAGSFDINPSTGQILTKAALDADTKANYAVVVLVHDGKAADGSESTSVDDQVVVSITVTDINESPTVTGTTSTEYAENGISSVETYLYDDEESDPVTWSLSGVDEDDFNITQLGELSFASSPDFETPTDSGPNNVYNVTVLVADGTSTTTHEVIVTVTNVNEPPAFPDTEDGQRDIDENTTAGTNIGEPVRAIDPDSGDTLTYTLDFTSADFFDIDESTGQLRTKADLDFELQSTYYVDVYVHDSKDVDGKLSTSTDASKYVTITVNDVNEPPVVTGDETPEVTENVGRYVGTYFDDDPENSTTSTWTLDGVDKDAFEISDGGVLSFLAIPDYEAQAEYSVTVQNSDSQLTGKLAVIITVINSDEGGEIELSSEQPQVGTPLTATLEDDDGSLSNIAWKWESHSATTTTWTTVSTTTAGNATSNAYTPTADDEGNTLRITSTYTDGHGSGKTVVEEPNNSVRPAPEVNSAPEFASPSVSRSIAENTSAGESIGDPVTAEDQNSGDILRYALEGPDAASFDIDSGTGQLKTKADLNYEGKKTYTVTVKASDPSQTSDTISVTINVTNVNEGPEISGNNSTTYTEGLLSVVETYNHNDPEGEDIVWSLGTILDENDFTITNGELRFAAPPDVENPTDRDQDNVYYAVVKVTDGEFEDELVVTVVVVDTNEGPEFPGATTSRDVSENTSAGQNVGSPVSATDPERDSLTYALGGTDAGHFDISTSTGQILTKSDLDYESGTKSYSVTVSVTDSKDANGETESSPTVDADIEVTINVIDEDEAPVLTGATSTSAIENATGTVSTYRASDPEGATTSWSIHGDASDFSISDDGELTIDKAPDYEHQNSYQIIVRASDAVSGGNIADLDVTVNVTNEDEPGVVTLFPASPEVGQQVNASLTDPDHLVTITGWSWHRSTDKSSWGSPITGATGSAYTPGNADEGNYLRATAYYEDGQGPNKTASSISDSKVPETNSQPSFSPNIVREIDENTPSGRNIGNPVMANDDEDDALKYSLGGDDADHFDISTTTGQLMTKGDLDFEEKPSYSVEVSVSDGKDVDNNPDDSTDATIPVTINVKNVNEAPELTGSETVDFDENATIEVAIYTATDPEDDSISWSVSGDDSNSFDIATGTLTFKSPPDFENQPTYNVTIVVTDGPNTVDLAVMVNINNVEEPGNVTLSPREPTVAAEVTATLRDPDGALSNIVWVWETSTDRNSWDPVQTGTTTNIASDTYTAATSDEGKSLRARATYTDPEGSGKEAIGTSASVVGAEIIINTAPVFDLPNTTREVPENTPEGGTVGTPVTATDQQHSGELTYTLGGPDASSFDIASTTGQILVGGPLDHEAVVNTFTVTVTATDPGGLKATATVTITVTNVDEPPTLTGDTSLTYPENTTRPVTTFTATDPENGRIVLVPKGDDGGRFRILDRVLNFISQPDYETALDDDGDNEYLVTIEASDGNSTTTLDIIVEVTNVNEPPQFPTSDSGTRSVTENTGAGQNVGAPVSASDPEGDSLTYALSGTDAAHFDISVTTGQILARSELDYEGRKSYSVTVSVRDSKNVDGQTDAVNDDDIDITINVIGENEAPVITGATSTNFAENGTRAVASYTGRDPEGGSVYWTVLGTDSAYFAITDSGVLSFDPAPDFEDPDDSDRNNVYHVTVQASDGNNINRLDMTVTVTNVEEPGEVELSSVQPQVDTKLTATLDDPDGVESTINWSWQRSRAGSKSSWSTISGATSDSYTPVTGDVDRYLRATATYDDGYSSGKSASAISENTVRAVPVNNDPPRFLSSFERRSVDENTAPGQDIGDPVEAVDDPADNLTYWLDGTNAGMFSIVRSTGQIQTRMPLDYETKTNYSVTVIAADPSNATTSVPVTIAVVNVDEAPVAVDDTASATEDGAAVRIDVLANDSDPEGMPLSLTAVTQPANGSASIVGTNVEYTPSAGYYGSDSFTYTVSDVNSNSSVGNVTISVAADSDPTVQTDTIAIQFVPIDGGGERILLSDYFSDPDEGHPPYQATTSDATIATVEVSEGHLTITPVGIGVATTTLTVSDTPGLSQEFRVVVFRPVVARTNTEAVHIVDPDVETTLVSEDEVLSVLFQAGARDQFFQVAVDAQSNNCGIEAPIDHQHICVLVDLFDLGAESIEESLNQNSTLDVTLDQTQYAAVAADVASGDFQMWKGHGPTDVSWDEIPQCPNPVGADECYELTADPNGGGKITVHNIAGFSEFAAGSDQPAPPPTEPPTTTPPPTTGGGGNTGGGSGSSGGGSGSGGSSSSSRYTRGNQTPQIFGQTDVTFSENSTDPVATYIAEDPDDDDLTWSLLGYDRGKFRISQEGVLSFRSPPDYEDPQGREGNTYRVILQAEDDGRPSEYDVHHVRVTVMQVNELGELSGDAELALPENNVAAIAQYDIEDPEKGTITWSLSGPDAQAFTIDEQGNLSPTAALDFENPGSSDDSNVHSLKITATDDGDPELSADMDVSVTITNVNEAPLVDEIPGVNLDSDEQPWLVDLNMYFSDPDGDNLEYDFTGQNITDVALAHLVGGTLSIDPVSGGDVSFYVVATDSGDLSAVTSVSVSVTEPEPVPTPAPAVTVPVPVSTPAPVVVVPVPTPTVPETVIVEPEPVPTFAPLPPLVEQKIRNQTQETDPVSKVIVAFALEPVDEPMAEVSLPPATEPAPPQKVSQVDEDAAAGHSPAPLSPSPDSSGGGLSIWMMILLAMVATATAGYGVRMYVIHRL